jgi:hypothetical protein
MEEVVLVDSVKLDTKSTPLEIPSNGTGLSKGRSRHCIDDYHADAISNLIFVFVS